VAESHAKEIVAIDNGGFLCWRCGLGWWFFPLLALGLVGALVGEKK
jgi:hypothetical protein